MSGTIFYLLIAGIAGSIMAFQGTINSALGKIIGLWEATFIVHIIGIFVVSLLLFGFRLGEVNWEIIYQAPWYVYLGGLLNVLIIFGVVYSIPKVGVGNATTMIVVFQVLTAVLIDHFGLFGMEKAACRWWDFIGIILLGIGVKILLQ